MVISSFVGVSRFLMPRVLSVSMEVRLLVMAHQVNIFSLVYYLIVNHMKPLIFSQGDTTFYITLTIEQEDDDDEDEEDSRKDGNHLQALS
jgi:hypothetical protein